MDRILDASLRDLALRDLARSGGVPVLPVSRAAAWRLPDPGKSALSRYGLPPARDDGLLGVVGGYQTSEQAETGADGSSFYVLGSYGTARLVAVEGVGDVLALPRYTDVHPDLAHLHPSGIQPSLVNSTIAALVDCAWRWHWILPLLAEEQRRAGEAEVLAYRAGRPADEPYAEYLDLCRHVLRRFQAIDPAVRADSGFWHGVIIDVW
ncbi:SUKH-4 family immunity protein [Saccharothrix deserti]|uniref:SUKH-4 family immunity protein n=1 Tax=Saccharothrix deserti TaxID=2593674 RepID=UPI00131BA5D4|nr:SUKH-4 family immunity protein [Saccharothrix deserti]